MANVLLTLAKTYACFASGSLAVLASLLDSVLDLVSMVNGVTVRRVLSRVVSMAGEWFRWRSKW